MGKYKTIVLGAVLVATLLAGCGDQNAVLEQHAEAEAASSPGTTEVPAFHFESGTLELGDFDPQTLGDDLFDPCTEISEEEFAAAGITGVESFENVAGTPNPDTNSCKSSELKPGISRLITGTKMNEIVAGAKPGIVLEHPQSDVVGIFTQVDPGRDPHLCIAQVDTLRGSLGVGVSERGAQRGKNDVCSLAVQSLERLYAIAN
ncbi:DUF3558 family protein [Corynebacterium hadale]